jgi:hypothetical protein
MSILIKGMKMPETCCECPLETDYGTCGYYSLFVEAGHDSDWKKRRDDCPLVELPDNGDAVSVIRCKDCKHNYSKKSNKRYNHEWIVCDYWETDGLNDDDFCSHGERNEE